MLGGAIPPVAPATGAPSEPGFVLFAVTIAFIVIMAGLSARRRQRS